MWKGGKLKESIALLWALPFWAGGCIVEIFPTDDEILHTKANASPVLFKVIF